MVVSGTEVLRTLMGWVTYFPLGLNPECPAVKNFYKQFRGHRNKLCPNLALLFCFGHSIIPVNIRTCNCVLLSYCEIIYVDIYAENEINGDRCLICFLTKPAWACSSFGVFVQALITALFYLAANPFPSHFI